MWGGPRDSPAWDLSRAPLVLVRAYGFRQRLLGLHAWKSWGAEPRGLLFPHCTMVHALGLARPICVVFLDRQGQILHHVASVAPGRWVRWPGAYATLELPVNQFSVRALQDALVQAWRAAEVSPARNVVA